MNNIWNELSEESREIIRQEYEDLQGSCEKGRIDELELLFGKENLNPRLPIKTWEDYEKTLTEEELNSFKQTINDICYVSSMKHGCHNISQKIIATLKIAILIEVAYGGTVTGKEWADTTKEKFVIVHYDGKLDSKAMTCNNLKDFIAFHTEEQRDEFFKNNEQLCKNYYML